MKSSKQSILFTVVFFFFTLMSCNAWINGEGPVITQKRSFASFTGVSNMVSADVMVTQGKQEDVRFEGEENILENLEAKVKGGVLYLEFKKNVRNYEKLKIYITIPEITKLEITGSGSFIGQNDWNVGDIELEIAGSGEIKARLNAKSVEAEIAGSGDINLSGSASNADFEIAGSGNIMGQDFQTENCKVEIAGSGDAKVHVAKKLNVEIAGSGNVFYKGNPTDLNTDIAGSGKLRKM